MPSTPPADERVTVLRAEGPVFCAGLDLHERLGGVNGERSIEACQAIETYSLPVVAVVQVDAIAAATSWHCTAIS